MTRMVICSLWGCHATFRRVFCFTRNQCRSFVFPSRLEWWIIRTEQH